MTVTEDAVGTAVSSFSLGNLVGDGVGTTVGAKVGADIALDGMKDGTDVDVNVVGDDEGVRVGDADGDCVGA